MGKEKQEVPGRRNLPTREEEETEFDQSEEEGPPPLSPRERECLNCKMFLCTHSKPDQLNIYDHLSHLLADILDERPDDPVAYFEDASRTLKRTGFREAKPQMHSPQPRTATETLSRAQFQLLKSSYDSAAHDSHLEQSEIDEKFQGFPNIMRQAFFLEQAGVGLPREEFVRIALAMKELMLKWPIESIRFWGKILGIARNYYVAEAQFREGEYESEMSDAEEDDLYGRDDDSMYDDLTSEDIKPAFKLPPKIPCEPSGTGLNTKVYFVCNEPGLPWVRLPHVTPAQIQAARKIRKFCTGHLDSPMVTFPPFPGVEQNYLRSQIARISACTQVSPMGYFRFDDEEEEEEAEESGPRSNCIVDTEFEGLPMRDLTDFNLQAWVHHSPAILPQGRVTWYNPVQGKGEFNEEEDEEEEERNEPDEPQPEVGPPMLTPLSEDESIGQSPAWITTTTSKLVPEHAVAVLHSNTWVGAVTFAADRGKFFENLYVGWGIKNKEAEFEPTLPDLPMIEFPSGPEITEADDPTPEMEAAVRAALQERELEMELEEDIDDDDGGEEEED